MKNDADIEQFILTEIVHNEEFARTVLPYVKDEYFSSEEYKIVFSEVKRHFDSYNTLPSKKALAIDVGNRSSLIEKQYDKVSDLVDVMYAEDYKQSTDLRWAVERAEEWCKHKAIYNAIVESANIIDPNNRDKKKKPFTAIEGIVREALSVTFDNSVGHDYYENAEDRYDFYHTKTKRVPFGMDVFNDITNGGLPNKTLNIILAGVHVGKSMFMCDYAANCVRQGRRVLYITCEMAEERIAERIDANLLDVPVDDVSLLQKKIFSERIGRLKTSFGTNGILKIKEYPTGSASVSHFRALLSELEVKQNFTPEVIIIDYLNICASMRFTGDQSNSYGYMKAVSEELRGLAIEHDVPILTACQLNRCLHPKTQVKTPTGLKDIDDISTGDKVLSKGGKWNCVLDKWENSATDMYEIELENGDILQCSDHHVFPVYDTSGKYVGDKSISSGLSEGESFGVYK